MGRERFRRPDQLCELDLAGTELFVVRIGGGGEAVSSFSATRELLSNRGSSRKAWANAWPPSAAAWKVCSPLTIRPSSSWSRPESAVKTTPVLCTRAVTAPSWEARTLTSSVGALDERVERGEVVVDRFPVPVQPFFHRLLPHLEGAARLRVERGQDVVERHRRFDLAVGQPAPVRQERRGRALRDQLHVALSQQRLLAHDRVHVRADRGILAVDFERRVAAAVLVDLQRDDIGRYRRPRSALPTVR